MADYSYDRTAGLRKLKTPEPVKGFEGAIKKSKKLMDQVQKALDDAVAHAKTQQKVYSGMPEIMQNWKDVENDMGIARSAIDGVKGTLQKYGR